MTDADRYRRKFCQRKMTDFVRVTRLVIPVSVKVKSNDLDTHVHFQLDRSLTESIENVELVRFKEVEPGCCRPGSKRKDN